VAGQDSPVLLLGETGVGKELIANFIHQHSARKDEPFIRVNSGAIPETLIDSELFGHEKGAFTGAVGRKTGRFEWAHGGTESIPVDIRVIAATNRNLEEMVAEGRFREDLWFRLNVFPIKTPPLRAKRSDIPALVDHFIEQKSRELKFRRQPTLAPDAISRLKNYSWPGNVRLNLTKGRVHGPRGAAAMLRINPSTLRNRIKKLGI
ncbi:MAG: sigma 54-interacting transcriptional regulator, partial [Thermodesulfobacteriota bacterium]|nr:sigma 54-interacting transcriptional regulator [Thermodesulfobacteriota bacterium]